MLMSHTLCRYGCWTSSESSTMENNLTPVPFQPVSIIIQHFPFFLISFFCGSLVTDTILCYVMYCFFLVENIAKTGAKMVIISNSSRRSSVTIEKVKGLGFDASLFLGAITSGELTHQYLQRFFFCTKICFHSCSFCEI